MVVHLPNELAAAHTGHPDRPIMGVQVTLAGLLDGRELPIVNRLAIRALLLLGLWRRPLSSHEASR